MRGSWVPTLRRAAVVVVSVWALANVLLADSASNHAQAVAQQTGRSGGTTIEPGVPAPPDTVKLNKGVSASAFDRRLALFEALVALIGVAAALSLLAWQAGAAARLVKVGGSRVRFGPARVVAAWLIPGLNLVAPAGSLAELFDRTDDDAPRRWRWYAVVGVWWAGCLGYAFLVARLIFTDPSGALRDRLVEWLGIIGVAIALLSVVMVLWIDARMADREIPEPEHPWSHWVSIGRGS